MTRKAGLVVVVGLSIVMALMAVLGNELASTQAKSKQDVEHQVHDRAILAAALIDSLFNTTIQQIPQDSQSFGGATIPAQKLAATVSQPGNLYAVVLGPNDEVLAATPGYNGQARAGLAGSGVLPLIRAGHQYALGNYAPFGQTGAIDFAVAFPTATGMRVLVTGFTPSALAAFLSADLRSIPGVAGENNYLIDGKGIVLASNNPGITLGSLVPQPGAVLALSRRSVESHGIYFDGVQLTNSTWHLILAPPNGPLFASVGGIHQLLPWLLFAGFALVALIALALGWRVLRASEQLQVVNRELASVNAELVDANASLQQRAAELARSNEELDQFASIASHDLQEPLRKVRTFTEQLNATEGEQLSDRGRDYLTRANSAAERMQNLIEDLLKFSRVSTQGRPFVPVDLDEIAQGVVSDLDAQIVAAGADVRLGRLPTIDADPLQMRQLLQNLISNAIKFRRPDVTPRVDVHGSVELGTLTLTVRDNGIGFEPRYSMRIFRVFERLHGRTEYPGTGIGLALCRKIVDRHGGTIVADGQPDLGSTFTITLPVSDLEDRARAGGTNQDMEAHADV